MKKRLSIIAVLGAIMAGIVIYITGDKAPTEWGGGEFYEVEDTLDVAYEIGDKYHRDISDVMSIVKNKMDNPEHKGEGYRIKKLGTTEWSRVLTLKMALRKLNTKLLAAPVATNIKPIGYAIMSEKSGFKIVVKKVDLNPAMVLDTIGTRSVDIIVGTAVLKFPTLKNLGIFNCRYIRGTTTWSQHAWGNAVDFGGSTELLDAVADYLNTLKEKGYIPLGTLLWRVPDHYTHIHAEGLPKMTGTPPCAYQ